jgi:hypothetical protein
LPLFGPKAVYPPLPNSFSRAREKRSTPGPPPKPHHPRNDNALGSIQSNHISEAIQYSIQDGNLWADERTEAALPRTVPGSIKATVSLFLREISVKKRLLTPIPWLSPATPTRIVPDAANRASENAARKTIAS